MKRYIDSYYAELDRQSWERQVASILPGTQTREQILTQLWLRGVEVDLSLPTSVLQHKLQGDRRKALGRRRRLRAAVTKVHSRETKTSDVVYLLASQLVKATQIPANV